MGLMAPKMDDQLFDSSSEESQKGWTSMRIRLEWLSYSKVMTWYFNLKIQSSIKQEDFGIPELHYILREIMFSQKHLETFQGSPSNSVLTARRWIQGGFRSHIWPQANRCSNFWHWNEKCKPAWAPENCCLLQSYLQPASLWWTCDDSTPELKLKLKLSLLTWWERSSLISFPCNDTASSA